MTETESFTEAGGPTSHAGIEVIRLEHLGFEVLGLFRVSIFVFRA
jgi:hypothetical protein